MPAGVLPGASRHTIPLTDQGAEGGRVPGVPLEGPIVAPRRQIFLPDVRGSLLFTDGRIKRVEDLVANTREDDKTWMNYCRDIRNHFTGLDNEKEKRLQGLEMEYQSKVLAHDLLIKKMAERMDKLEETACKCGNKRKRSQEEYKTPSPNFELITDVFQG